MSEVRALIILRQQILMNLSRMDIDLMTPSDIFQEISDCIEDTIIIVNCKGPDDET